MWCRGCLSRAFRPLPRTGIATSRFLLLSSLEAHELPLPPDGIAAICLAVRDQLGLVPHVHFDWTEGSLLALHPAGFR